MEEKITVGIFWICDEGERMGIIYDKEEYSPDWKSDLGDEFIMYEKAHEDVWKTLATKAYGGQYKDYEYDDFPRGRITYDKDEEVYMIDYDEKIKPMFSKIKAKIYQLFGLSKAVWQPAPHLQSSKGRFNK